VNRYITVDALRSVLENTTDYTDMDEEKDENMPDGYDLNTDHPSHAAAGTRR